MTVLQRMQRCVVKGCRVMPLVACAWSWACALTSYSRPNMPEVDMWQELGAGALHLLPNEACISMSNSECFFVRSACADASHPIFIACIRTMAHKSGFQHTLFCTA